MNAIGVDFDNTIIDYSHVFYDLALAKGLISSNINRNKATIKNFIVNNYGNEKWTKLQGEVYGKEIHRAKPFKGVKETFREIKKRGYMIKIVSHRTKFPYLGKRYDLHKAAKQWIKENDFLSDENIGITDKDIFFETEMESKIKKINELNFKLFVDDLIHILESIESNTIKVLFGTNAKEKSQVENIYCIDSWTNLLKII